MNPINASNNDSPSARVLLVSMRGGNVRPNRCLPIEFEDTIENIDDVYRMDMRVTPRNVFTATRSRFDQYCPRVSALFGTNMVPRRKPFDLVFFYCSHVHDMRTTVPLQPILNAGQMRACFVEEIWKGQRPASDKIKWLQRFDILFTSCSDSAEELEKLTGRTTKYLPPSVDTIRWSVPGAEPQRCVDVLWYGRQIAGTHRAIQALAEKHGLFYVFDTIVANHVIHKVEHRTALARLVNRSHCVFVNPAKADRTNERGEQSEIGYRFFEAAAGGAILIGDHPQTTLFDEMFGWPESIFRIPLGSVEVGPVIMPILENEELRRRVSLRNRIESLRRHDVVYRWQDVLRTVGLPETDAMEKRVTKLHDHARALSSQLGRSPFVGARPEEQQQDH